MPYQRLRVTFFFKRIFVYIRGLFIVFKETEVVSVLFPASDLTRRPRVASLAGNRRKGNSEPLTNLPHHHHHHHFFPTSRRGASGSCRNFESQRQPCVFDLSNCLPRGIPHSNSASLEVQIDIGYLRRIKLSLYLSVGVALQGKLFLAGLSFDIQVPNRPRQLPTAQFARCHPLRQVMHLTWRNSSSRSRVKPLKHPWTVSCRTYCVM